MIKRSSRSGARGTGVDQHSIDGRLTNLGFAVFVAALALGVIIALWAQAANPCGDGCRTTRRGLGDGLTYGGLVASCIVAFGGARRAAGRGTMRSIWPVIGIVVVIASLVIGTSIAGSA